MQQLKALLCPTQAPDTPPLLHLHSSSYLSSPNSMPAARPQQLESLPPKSHGGSSLLFSAARKYIARPNPCSARSRSIHGEDEYRSNSALAPQPSINITHRYISSLPGNPYTLTSTTFNSSSIKHEHHHHHHHYYHHHLRLLLLRLGSCQPTSPSGCGRPPPPPTSTPALPPWGLGRT